MAGLTTLRSPGEEQGDKKSFDQFVQTLATHVGIEWNNGSDVAHILDEGKDPTIAYPANLSNEDKKNDALQLRWKRQADAVFDREDDLKKNKRALFALVTHHLSAITKSKVQSMDGYTKAKGDGNPIWLMESLESVMTEYETVNSPAQSIDQSLQRIMTVHQQQNEPNDDFVQRVYKEIKIFDKRGGDFMWGPHYESILDADINQAKLDHYAKHKTLMTEDEIAAERKIRKKVVKQRAVSMRILQSCNAKYKPLLASLP